MTLALHLGAHKTATTFQQEALTRAAPDLAERGVHILPLDDLRQSFTRRLHLGEDAAAGAWLSEVLDRPGRVVLSDENLLGAPARMVHAGALYPDAAERLARLARLIGEREVEIFYAIRHQGQFSRSVFCEALRTRLDEVPDPDTFRAGWLERGVSWRPVIEAIRSAFPAAKLFVWSLQSFKKDAQGLLGRIAGAPGHSFDLSDVYRRESFSHAATEALLRIGREEGTEAMYHARDRMARKHPRQEGDWQYRLWSEDDVKVFQRAIRQDLRALRDGKDVTLLE